MRTIRAPGLTVTRIDAIDVGDQDLTDPVVHEPGEWLGADSHLDAVTALHLWIRCHDGRLRRRLTRNLGLELILEIDQFDG